MAKKVSDEKLLEMLLVHGGVRGAAAVLGISQNAVYKRLKDDSFRQQYDVMQGALLSTAAASMVNALDKAVSALLAVLNDTEASAGLKVSAANALLNHCCRYVETSNVLRRLEALEDFANAHNKQNQTP